MNERFLFIDDEENYVYVEGIGYKRFRELYDENTIDGNYEGFYTELRKKLRFIDRNIVLELLDCYKQ